MPVTDSVNNTDNVSSVPTDKDFGKSKMNIKVLILPGP